ncbi:MAG: MarR family transcriptional regulator [Oscillospiraceae bacterium]
MRKKIGIEFRAINNLIGRFIENHCNKKSVDSITGTNGWIIGYISEHSDTNIYQKNLEEEFSITRSTASKVVNLMVEKGLIQRQTVAHDARLRKLVLTQKAEEVVSLMAEDGVRVENTLLRGFSEPEILQLYAYLARIKENLLERK